MRQKLWCISRHIVESDSANVARSDIVCKGINDGVKLHLMAVASKLDRLDLVVVRRGNFHLLSKLVDRDDRAGSGGLRSVMESAFRSRLVAGDEEFGPHPRTVGRS